MTGALVITDQNYAGEAASVMITRAVVNMDTVEKGAIYIIDGIKKAFRMPRLEVAGFMQHRSATPISAGTITVDGNLLEPKDYMVYLEFNPRDFEQHWYAYQLSEMLLDRSLPQTAESFLIYQLSKRVNEFNENQIWRGRIAYDPANGGLDPTSKGAPATDAQFMYFDGLIVKLLNDAGTLAVSSPATLVASGATGGQENILDALKRVLYTVPNALVDKKGPEGVKFLMNITTKRIYDTALVSLTYKDTQTVDSSISRYQGYEVLSLAGLPDNTIIAAKAMPDTDSAFWLGLNSKEDEQTVKLQYLQNNSELWFLKMLLKAAVQFAFSDQIVLYTTITA